MTTLHTAPGQETPTEAPTDATRHLCAGVYVNEKFRDLVIGEICTTPYRRVAPSYGFDLVPVMRHAWWATHMSTFLRLTMLASVAAPFFLGHPVTTALTAGGLALLLLLDRAVSLSAEIARSDEQRMSHSSKRKRSLKLPSVRDWKYKEEVRTLKRLGIAALTVGLVMAVLGMSSPQQSILAGYLGCAVLGAAALMGAVRQVRINRVHKAETTLRPRKLSAREKVVSVQQDHPCVVYRRPAHKGKDAEEREKNSVFMLFGEKSPFIGAGELIHQWNPPMSVQLLRPGSDDQPLHEREHRYPPFEPHELVDHLRSAVHQLRGDDENVRLPVDVRDRVYVAEADASGDRSLLRGAIGEASMRRIIDEQDPTRHHFLEMSVPDAGSELVATVLLQVGLRGRTLSLSSAACVLTRTPDSFRKAEEFGQHGKRAVVGAAFGALGSLPREAGSLWHVVRYPLVLAKALLLYRRDLTLTPIRNVSIGSRLSVREEQAQEWSKAQFDKTRLLGHVKNIEQRLLKATSGFLHSRGVDISDFDDRAMQIINSGIVNLGGTNDISNNVVGHATQINNNVPQWGSGPSQNGNSA
ncbi:hypothetical protein [Nocardiopsis valliformis]|uniref:hypothetical protein n=1 Tax=Nocardiopsis valliformis TaxID=239974 RepID=UPI00034AD779|nr:hypothetical protein [Nocardiopsis valliformis]